MEIQGSFSQYLRAYPAPLHEAVDTIHRNLPDLLPSIQKIFGEAISIKLVVDIPKDDQGTVAAQDLSQKEISTKGIPEASPGRIAVTELAKENIFIQEEREPALWDWHEKTIYLSYSTYGKRPFYQQDDYQLQNLLFEMYNAYHTPKFIRLTKGSKGVSKEEFVRQFEGVEHLTIARTNEGLARIAENKEFSPSNNLFRMHYRDAELNFLFQQVGGHSDAIAQKYDVFYPSLFKKAFHGTWMTRFDPENGKHQLIRGRLDTILQAHLRAIDSGDRKDLDAEVQKIRQGVQFGEEWAKTVMVNLKFFQKKYQEYVTRETPETIIHILDGIDVSLTCVQQQHKVGRSLFSAFLNAIRA